MGNTRFWTPSSLNPGAIDLKFGTVDFVWVRLHTPKIVKIGPVESSRHRGERSFLFFLVFDFLPSAGEHIFGGIAVVFAPYGVFQRGLIS